MDESTWRVVAVGQALIGVVGSAAAAMGVVDGYWLVLGPGWLLLGGFTWYENG